MEADDARLQSVILTVVVAQAFHDQLLPTVCILRHGRIGILFLERNHVGIGLLVFWVDTGRGCVEITLRTIDAGRIERVGVDQRIIVQDLGMMG